MDVVDSFAATDVYYVNSSLTHFPYDPTVDIIDVHVLPCGLSTCNDFNYDGSINLADFAVLAAQWAGSICGSANGFCEGSDFDYNGLLDSADLEQFVAHWPGEIASEPQVSNLVENGTVDMDDLILLLSRWLDADCSLSNNFCSGTDLNRSGSVDFEDLVRFGRNRLTACSTQYNPYPLSGFSASWLFQKNQLDRLKHLFIRRANILVRKYRQFPSPSIHWHPALS